VKIQTTRGKVLLNVFEPPLDVSSSTGFSSITWAPTVARIADSPPVKGSL
jgi:hypothetical protein